MSFITKRERVFNEYDLFDLPPRNEGKLKAYASCTDARAWSHFCSDKSEHLVEIIKRNNEVCRPKYVPTEAIVNTLLAHKQAEIARLKRKIEEFEQMVAAYDELELSCEQKCEIAKAHATIKEANKDLNELWFDLDLSGYTGIDSEDFETGKSRGDELSRVNLSLEEDEGNELGDETPRSKSNQSKGDEWISERELPQRESKGNQAGETKCISDASTNVVDPRIEEMRDVIIAKDAKLNAMRNTYAVIENDACEPYCIYAHIYTALEKIFGILCQNDKYKLYLNLMTAGKDLRGIDIKGRILFKLKVLEKFSLALLAPCSRDVQNSHSEPECSCYRAEIVPVIETAYALTSSEIQKPLLDSKRAQLVADIMENEEMKELLNKDFKPDIDNEDVNEEYNIDEENFKRLKNLQQNYDDLMNCYEALKHEKDCLQIRCRKYEELEKEFENLQTQLREYNSLWNEKEHYRKRSQDLDSLKEQYLMLCDETSNLETELKAENEINAVKTKTIDELRSDNIALEKKLNDASIAFEKERNCAQCKLKEAECKIMCQEQQIKSLSIQIDSIILEQDPNKLQPKQSQATAIALIDEMNSLKEQIKNLQDALFCTEEENQQLQLEYQNKLNLINDLKMEIEDLKSNYEKILVRNDYLEKYTNSFRDEVQKLVDENRDLSQDIEQKQHAINNLINIISNKSQEIDKLMKEIEHKSKENSDLYAEIRNLHDSYSKRITAIDNEKSHAMQLLHISKKESQNLLERVKDYDDLVNKQEIYEKQNEELNQLNALLISTQQENENLQKDLTSRENNKSILLQEVQRLQDCNNFAVNSISALQDEKNHYKLSLELTKKDSKIIEDRLHSLEDLSYKFQQLKESHEKLIQEKCRLENELANKTLELDNAIHTNTLTKKESEELEVKLKSSEHLKSEFESVDSKYKKLAKKQQRLQSELDEKKQGFDSLLESYNKLKNNLKIISDQSSEEVQNLIKELSSLKYSYNELLAEKDALQNDYDGKNEEINNLYNTLEGKIDENKELSEQIQLLELRNITTQSNIHDLQEEHHSTTNVLNNLKKESEELMERVKFYETIELNYDQLKREHEQMQAENLKLQNELDVQKSKLSKIAEDNEALHSESQHLLSHSEDLEKALINARTELIGKTSLNNLQMDIIKEIDEMKKEKVNNNIRIRDLFNKLDESENIISDLSENILARDDKIAILENHINELQDEVKRLHRSLAELVDTGEQMQDISHKKIAASLYTMEAHHSKATHNMKMELAKLQSEKIKLEEHLSISKIKSEDSTRDKHEYISQITHLQNEREIIVTDIKQLEMKSVGDSSLSPEHCDVEDILCSLDRIRRYVDARSIKTTSLEQTLLKVQNSYQVVQSKADEAKKIVEKEKHKMLSEKEEAIRDRINMEKQLTDLKDQLEKQISHDKKVIKDLEAEILNQKLICDKLNTSTQNYISKLKVEMQSLQNLYQKSLENISEIENRLQLMCEEKNTYLDAIQNINSKLQEKIKEIDMLKKELENLQNKPSNTLGTQISVVNNRDNDTQTYEEFLYEGYDQYEDNDKLKSCDQYSDQVTIHAEKSLALEKKIGHIEQPKQENEIQVLVANVEPTFDYIRNSYLNYKLKNLSPGRLEQYSISCTSENYTELDTKEKTETELDKSSAGLINSQSNDNSNVIDIYNKQSIHTNSSKNIDANYTENERATRSPGITSAITDFGLTVDSFGTKNSMHKASTLFGSVSGISTDKDLFVIYKDNQSNEYDKKTWPGNKQSEVLVKAVTVHPDRYDVKSKQYDVDNDTYSYLEDDELREDDSVKNKLKINLPRVETDSPAIDISSDYEKKSLDSYNIQNSLSNEGTKFLESYGSTEDEYLLHIASKTRSRNNPDFDESTGPDQSLIKQITKEDSHHKLSRTDADVRLVRRKTGHTVKKFSATGKNSINDKPASHFGLDYIHATADNMNTYNAAAALRKTRSDKMFSLGKVYEKIDSSRFSEEHNTSTDNKTYSARDQPSYIIRTNQKAFTDQEVLVKLDTTEEYEIKIKNLTNNLENIEKDYKKNIDAIKIQYDSHIKSIINEHNKGVKSIQGLHEETLQDIIKHHENEVENLRTMSIEAMRKADKLEKEIRSLKYKMPACSSTCLNEEPIKISTSDLVQDRQSRVDTKTLTKTNVEAFNVRPKNRSSGPCTCSLDINISDTIRNIFEQVDVDQRKIAEQTYLKYIANKILNSTVETLDCQELSFLHLKVCRIWKVKLSKEETLQRRISSLEAEVMHKQRHNQHNIAELDRQVAEERRRLQEVREAVCRNAPTASRYSGLDTTSHLLTVLSHTTDIDRLCGCNTGSVNLNVGERKSGGDLCPAPSTGPRQKRTKTENNRAVLVKLDADGRREKKLYNDEPPTRLRRPHERHPARPAKK